MVLFNLSFYKIKNLLEIYFQKSIYYVYNYFFPKISIPTMAFFIYYILIYILIILFFKDYIFSNIAFTRYCVYSGIEYIEEEILKINLNLTYLNFLNFENLYEVSEDEYFFFENIYYGFFTLRELTFLDYTFEKQKLKSLHDFMLINPKYNFLLKNKLYVNNFLNFINYSFKTRNSFEKTIYIKTIFGSDSCYFISIDLSFFKRYLNFLNSNILNLNISYPLHTDYFSHFYFKITDRFAHGFVDAPYITLQSNPISLSLLKSIERFTRNMDCFFFLMNYPY